MKSSNFDSFSDWFKKDFIQRNGGYHPTKMKLWWDRVESSHEKLRSTIGGVMRERRMVLKAHQNPTTQEAVAKDVAVIKAILPEYLTTYQYDDSVFLRPTIDSGTHNVIKTAKHIRQYAETRLDQYYPENKEKLALVDKALSCLGTAWSRARVSDTELDVTLSTSAKGFVLLGHYGPDHDSCFRQGSDKTDHKYIFGQTNDTFVLTISKPNDGRHKNIVRFVGFTNDNLTVFNLANCYFLPGTQEGDSLEAIRMFLEDMWGDKATLVENKVFIPKELVYHNPYGNWSFVKGSKIHVGQQALSPNINNIRLFVCPKCGTEDNGDKNWEDVDDEFICKKCHSNAFVCALTGKKTFKELIPLIDKDGSVLMVCEEASVGFPKCDLCEVLSKELTAVADGNDVCCNCLDGNFTCCDNCEKFFKDDEVFSGDEEICADCITFDNINPFDDKTISFVTKFIEKSEHYNNV